MDTFPASDHTGKCSSPKEDYSLSECAQLLAITYINGEMTRLDPHDSLLTSVPKLGSITVSRRICMSCVDLACLLTSLRVVHMRSSPVVIRASSRCCCFPQDHHSSWACSPAFPWTASVKSRMTVGIGLCSSAFQLYIHLHTCTYRRYVVRRIRSCTIHKSYIQPTQ